MIRAPASTASCGVGYAHMNPSPSSFVSPASGPRSRVTIGRELVDHPHGGGVTDAVGVRGEVLEVAEQERDLDRGGCPGDVGGDWRLAEGDLGELPLQPAAMHGGEHDVGDGSSFSTAAVRASSRA